MEAKYMIENEEGSTMLVVLVLLVLLSLLGASSNDTTMIEVQIAANERMYKQNFYLAEAAALEGVLALETAGEEIKYYGATSPIWLINTDNLNRDGLVLPAPGDELNNSNWTGNYSSTAHNTGGGDVKYQALFQGVSVGSSLDASRSTIYEYRVLGKSEKNALSMIDIGFKRAF
jgi:Tfp pilus assembly protein PilX